MFHPCSLISHKGITLIPLYVISLNLGTFTEISTLLRQREDFVYKF